MEKYSTKIIFFFFFFFPIPETQHSNYPSVNRHFSDEKTAFEKKHVFCKAGYMIVTLYAVIISHRLKMFPWVGEKHRARWFIRAIESETLILFICRHFPGEFLAIFRLEKLLKWRQIWTSIRPDEWFATFDVQFQYFLWTCRRCLFHAFIYCIDATFGNTRQGKRYLEDDNAWQLHQKIFQTNNLKQKTISTLISFRLA